MKLRHEEGGRVWAAWVGGRVGGSLSELVRFGLDGRASEFDKCQQKGVRLPYVLLRRRFIPLYVAVGYKYTAGCVCG